jgi:hypothetical protein
MTASGVRKTDPCIGQFVVECADLSLTLGDLGLENQLVQERDSGQGHLLNSSRICVIIKKSHFCVKLCAPIC